MLVNDFIILTDQTLIASRALGDRAAAGWSVWNHGDAASELCVAIVRKVSANDL